MKHRCCRQHAVRLGESGNIGQGYGEGMQDLRTVAVKDAPGPAGRSRRIAERRRRVLVELRPGEVIGCLAQQLLVAQRADGSGGQRPFRLGHMHPVGHQHDLPHPFGPAERRLRLGKEGRIDKQNGVLGLVEDPGDLVGMQPRVDGVADGADAGDGIEDFQVPVGAVGECRHPVARAHP